MPEITWTVLPNGVTAQNKLKVSIFVSLRLDSDTALGASFNWAQMVAAFNQAKLEFSDGTTATAVNLDLDKSLLSPNLWQKVFPQTSKVVARAPLNHSARPIISYPAKAVRQNAETMFSAVAENLGFMAPGFGFNDGEHGNPVLVDFISRVGQEISGFERTPVGGGGPVITIAATPASATGAHPGIDQLDDKGPFYQAYRFYRRSLNGQPQPPTEGWPKLAVDPPDFHKVIGMLGDHPHLLRRFGLVIDGTVDRGAVPSGASKVRFLASSVNDDFTFTHTDKAPATLFVLGTTSFLPKPGSSSDLDQGLLTLGDSDPDDGDSAFEIHQLDVDGAALKLADYAVNLLGSSSNPSAEVPNLRTAGFVVCRNSRKTQLAARLARSAELETASDIELTADDVTRGYRLDVRRQSDGIWRSLCQRTGHFLLGASGERVPSSGEVHDEGYIKGTAATSDPVADGDPLVTGSKPLYVHEAMFNWDGWSPVIAAPGRATHFDREHGEQLSQIENTPATDFKVQPVFKVEPGTLPKLRFGETYQLRARAVDLAGNSLQSTIDTSDASLKTAATRFNRYEPLPPPVLVLRRKVVEGESIEHVVIRSEGTAHKAHGDVYFDQNDRHLAPPSTTLDLVLMHGVVDSVLKNAGVSYNLALRSEGTFLNQQIWDKNGHRKSVSGIAVVNTDGSAGQFPTERGAGLSPGQYVIHKNSTVALPYLPDPLAIGAAMVDGRDEDHQTAAVGVKTLTYKGSWPDLEPTRVTVVSSSSTEPSVEVNSNGFLVKLPPGTILPLLYSSRLRETDLKGKMAVWDLIDPAIRNASDFLAKTLNGQHWMLTPRRTLLAVHAVQRPLKCAKFTALSLDPVRAQGETFVRLKATVDLHAHSTGQIDLEASWTDPVDRLTESGPSAEDQSGHVFTFRPDYDTPTVTVPREGFVPDEERPKQDFGDTKHRFVRYRPDSTTRYREYFPPSITADRNNILLPGEELEVNIPSSNYPASPEVLYVIPTFRWQTQQSSSGHGSSSSSSVTSTRVGRGLRVYLARPWFSSGIGELLGVVIPRSNTPTDQERRFVSEWGKDPLWRGTGPNAQLTPADFVNPSRVSADLNVAEDATLADADRAKVRAVGFNVEYNAERQLWFADIEIGEVASYFPFIRLALARYQPDSIEGVSLSSIVKAEFAQLVNDRAAVVQTESQTLRITVSGIASPNKLGEAMSAPSGSTPTPPPGYKSDFAAGAGRLVTVQLEKRGPGHSDEAWVAVGGQVALPSFSPTSPGSAPTALWTGTLPRPPRTPASFDYRVVIREIEIFQTDSDVAQTLPVTAPSGVPVRGHVVYLDVVQLGDCAR